MQILGLVQHTHRVRRSSLVRLPCSCSLHYRHAVVKIEVYMRIRYGIQIYVLVWVLQGSCLGRNLCCSGVDNA